MRITVAPGHTKDEAIRQFEQQKGHPWKSLASGYDVTEIRTDEKGKLVEESTRHRNVSGGWRAEGGQDRHWEQASQEIAGEDAAPNRP